MHDSVHYTLWSVPADPNVRDFEQRFGDVAVRLGNRAEFTPHVKIYRGREAGLCVSNGGSDCLNLCSNNGRYCAGRDDVREGVSGVDIVSESLRRLCIWDLYGGDGIGKQWWDYVKFFSENCAQSQGETLFSSPACIKDAMRRAGVAHNKVENCIDFSGGLKDDVPVTFFELEVSNAVWNSHWPALVVEDDLVPDGASDCLVAFEAICARYGRHNIPPGCSLCASCICDGAALPSSRIAASSVRFDVVVAVVAGLSVFLGIVVYCLYQRSQAQVQDQVRAQVRGVFARAYQYVSLDEYEMVSMDPSSATEKKTSIS